MQMKSSSEYCQTILPLNCKRRADFATESNLDAQVSETKMSEIKLGADFDQAIDGLIKHVCELPRIGTQW